MIGVKCSECEPGYYGFPNCIGSMIFDYSSLSWVVLSKILLLKSTYFCFLPQMIQKFESCKKKCLGSFLASTRTRTFPILFKMITIDENFSL